MHVEYDNESAQRGEHSDMHLATIESMFEEKLRKQFLYYTMKSLRLLVLLRKSANLVLHFGYDFNLKFQVIMIK